MLAETETVAAIDIGTTKVCTIIGRRSRAKGVHVLGHSTVPCSGLRKGNVTDAAAAAKAVRESIEEVQRTTGYHIESAFVGVSGAHVGFENRRDSLDSLSESKVITAHDVNSSLRSLSGSLNQPGRKVIHAIRMSYSLDGEVGIRDPVGMHSSRVEVETHLVTGGTAFIERLVQVVEQAGIKVKSLVLEPLASGMAVLTAEEKERGAMIVDVGGGTTDVVGFRRGRVYYSGVIPVGGYQFTNDIALTFNTPYEAAEDAKIRYASANLQLASTNEEIPLPVVGRDDELLVQRVDLCQLVRERAQELVRMIKVKLDHERVGDYRDAQLVLTGGTSNLPGLAALMQKGLSVPVRQGVPIIPGTIPDELKNPVYATSLGILLWAVTEYTPETVEAESRSERSIGAGREGFFFGLLRRVSKLMPVALFASRKGRI